MSLARPVLLLRGQRQILHRHLVSAPASISLSRVRGVKMSTQTSNPTSGPQASAPGDTPSAKQSSGGGITSWASSDGEFRRQPSQFRNWISSKPGSRFPPESGRYHLYVSYACPWAHRTLIVRALKGLQRHIGVTAVHWHMGERGWRFVTEKERKASDDEWKEIGGDREWVTPDPLEGHEGYTHLRDVYFGAEKGYKGRFTVPTLYDKKEKTIVSNESSEIIRMFYHEFDALLDGEHAALDLLPKDVEQQVDQTNDWIYPMINNGVYRSGFATTQAAYEAAAKEVFEGLDRVEEHLRESSGPFWFGERLTEVDVRLYTTIVRFDPVYVQHFKCNLRDIRSGYPYIHRWVRNLYWNFPAFHQTTDFTHIKCHYTRSHSQINPYGITPMGPLPDILPLDREVNTLEEAKAKI